MEKSGLVWTSLKAPNSGRPKSAQPALERASLRIVGEADGLLRVAERLRHRLPHRDHQRRADDRRVLVGGERGVGLEVDQPAPQRRGGRPRDRLERAAGDLASRRRRRRRSTASTNTGLAVDLRAGGVEALDQRLEQHLLLGRVGEGDADRARGSLRGGLARLGRGVVAAAPGGQRDHGDGRDGDGEDDELAALHPDIFPDARRSAAGGLEGGGSSALGRAFRPHCCHSRSAG